MERFDKNVTSRFSEAVIRMIGLITNGQQYSKKCCIKNNNHKIIVFFIFNNFKGLSYIIIWLSASRFTLPIYQPKASLGAKTLQLWTYIYIYRQKKPLEMYNNFISKEPSRNRLPPKILRSSERKRAYISYHNFWDFKLLSRHFYSFHAWNSLLFYRQIIFSF